MRTPRRLRPSPLPPLHSEAVAQLEPSQFRVNQAWLVHLANRTPISIEGVPVAVYVLQDAGSMFLFGNVFAPWNGGSPRPAEAVALLKRAWAKKQQWPEKLLLPDTGVPVQAFAAAASSCGIPSEVLPASVFSVYSTEVQQAYEEHFGKPNAGDA